MIPKDYISEWGKVVPWPSDIQVEHDLVISRALLDIFDNAVLSKAVAFRGGTALSKLYFENASRFSEDIDLVQLDSSIKTFEELRKTLDPWLGNPRRTWSEGSMSVVYRYSATDLPETRVRLKIEINTRENYSLFGCQQKKFEIKSRWKSGTVQIQTYSLNELLGTKLRALYQRKKGRDLFDLWFALTKAGANPDEVVDTFNFYIGKQGLTITKDKFLSNLDEKLKSSAFLKDITPLLSSDLKYDPKEAGKLVTDKLLLKLK